MKKGDHVGLYLYNGTEYIEAALAAYKIGACSININYRYVEEELEYLFDNADLVAPSTTASSRRASPSLSAKMPKLRTFVSVDDGSGADISAIGSADYESSLAAASAERNRAAFRRRRVHPLHRRHHRHAQGGDGGGHEDLFFSALMGVNPYGPPPETPEQVVETAAAKGVMTASRRATCTAPRSGPR